MQADSVSRACDNTRSLVCSRQSLSSSIVQFAAVHESLLRLERPGAVAVVFVGQPVDVAVGVQRVEAVLVAVLGLSQRCAAAALLGGARLCGYDYRELRPAREPLTRGVRMDRKNFFYRRKGGRNRWVGEE